MDQRLVFVHDHDFELGWHAALELTGDHALLLDIDSGSGTGVVSRSYIYKHFYVHTLFRTGFDIDLLLDPTVSQQAV